MERAAVTELGPGIGTTVWPAAHAAVTRACPGSDSVGVPASLTRATSPPSSAASTRGRPRRSTGAVAEERLADAVPGEQPGSHARVLGGDRRDLAQDAQRPGTDVFEVAYWRCHDV